jgi:hypothetical protein
VLKWPAFLSSVDSDGILPALLPDRFKALR